MASFSIEQKLFEKFNGLNIGAIEGECSSNEFSDEGGFLEFKKRAEEVARRLVPVVGHPYIAAWRKAFKAFGADPTKTRSSAEALVRRLQKGGSIPSINAVVDVYNAVSAKEAIPVGGQDSEKIVGGVVLRFAGARENFIPLGSAEQGSIDEGEVVYADEEKVLCSKWNYRDCEPAKISAESTKFILFVDGAPSMPRVGVELATKELAWSLTQYVKGCNASWRISP